jgi:hypothetical protein
MDEQLERAVTTGAAIVAKMVTQAVARKGLTALRAKGVKVPVWTEHVATWIAGAAVGFGGHEMLKGSAGDDRPAEPGFVVADPSPGLEPGSPPHSESLPTMGTIDSGAHAQLPYDLGHG